MELDVFARDRACLQPDSLTDDEGDGLCFGLPHGFAGGTLVTTMQKLAGEFMDDDRELVGRLQARPDADPSAA